MRFSNLQFSLLPFLLLILFFGCTSNQPVSNVELGVSPNPSLSYKSYEPQPSDLVISRSEYKNRLEGFWLAQCIGNWTGLVTEMDKIGNIGDIQTGNFYTRGDWGQPDQPSIWAEGVPSDLSPTIDFVFENEEDIWGADDDTDIEYIYQELLLYYKTSLLTGSQIREGWLKHILPKEENFLWVSNQAAFDLMKEGIEPPETSNPEKNPHFEMIDAQLTTEIFGFYAPGRPDIAKAMAKLPIRTTARENAEWIAQFYVSMYSMASNPAYQGSIDKRLIQMAENSRLGLPNNSYAADMYDFVKARFEAGDEWEEARDKVYQRYQVEQTGGYDITAQNLYCNGCFAAGINFASSLVSLFYGKGDLKETIKIGCLAGWDSDNPTATWAGLIGFMIGKDGVEEAFGREFSNQFNIHRTRQGFPNNGMDNFPSMAEKGVHIVDRVVQEQMEGGIDLEKDVWYVPSN